MEKIYEKPEFEVMHFEVEDIIASTPEVDIPTDPDEM